MDLFPPPPQRRLLHSLRLCLVSGRGVRVQLLASLVSQGEDSRADGGAVAAVFPRHYELAGPELTTKISDVPFPPRLGDAFCKVPQSAFGLDRAFGVSTGCPFGSELDFRGGARVAGFGLEDDALFFESLVHVLEGFFVDGFEVAEVALVV